MGGKTGRRRSLEYFSMSKRRHYAYAACSEEEYAVVKAAAAAEGLSVSDFVRRCVNGFLVEQSDDGLLLAEAGSGD